MKKMKILLIEDEPAYSQKYEECMEYLPYSAELNIANGCKGGIELAKSVEPDLVLLDLELNESDGDGILFLEHLKELHLPTTPYIIVTTINTSRRIHRAAREGGADYIFTKSKPDYSPRLVLDFAYQLLTNQVKKETPADEDKYSLEGKIASDMEKVGVTNGISGKNYIVDAVLIILNLYKNKIKPGNIVLTTHVYPVIARKYGKSDKTVEQGIRNAIKRAWNLADLDALAENYTAQVSYNTGFPENRDFIFYYVDKYKNEVLTNRKA